MTNEQQPHDYENQFKREQLEKSLRELGFIETEEMSRLKTEILEASTLEIAKPPIIRYRELGESEVDKIDAQQQLLARVALPIAMAVLYQENHRFEELEEYFLDELDDAETLVSYLEDGPRKTEVLDMIGKLYK